MVLECTENGIVLRRFKLAAVMARNLQCVESKLLNNAHRSADSCLIPCFYVLMFACFAELKFLGFQALSLATFCIPSACIYLNGYS